MANPLLKTRQIADLQVTNGKLASDVGRANLLTNGGFEIWQRGNGPFTANNAYTADRWQIQLGGSSTISVQRTALPAPGGGLYSFNGSSYTHNALSLIAQLFNEVPLPGVTVTLSMWVWCSAPNAIRLNLFDSPSGGDSYSSYHPGNSTWTQLTVTRTLGASATSVRVSAQLSASCGFYLDNAMLVVGNVAADYAPLHPADDLARCLRYYEVIGGQTVGVPQFFGYSTNTQWSTTLPYKARKAVSPVVTKTGTWAVTNCNQPSLVGELDSVVIYTVVTATGHFNMASNAAGQTITIEANP